VCASSDGPAHLDVDVLLVGDLISDDPDIIVPTHGCAERRLVLAPLAELAPDLVSASGSAASSGDVVAVGTLR
jgi:7,8-dihydro-6-hydroxymethylpterin-pyrophosphokinase